MESKKHKFKLEEIAPKVFDDPEIQKSYEEMRKAAMKVGLIGKITFS